MITNLINRIKLLLTNLNNQFHRALDMLISLKTIVSFIAGACVALMINHIVSNYLHITCDSGPNKEGFYIEKDGVAYCFIRDTRFPNRTWSGIK